MTSSLIGRRVIVSSPLILAIVALAMLLAVPRQALAAAGCTSSVAKRDVCARAQSHSARKHSKAKKHHTRHAVSKKAKKHAKHQVALPPARPITQGAPVCEDGSTPIALGQGVYSCDDESEPTCENGTKPTPSASGGSLVCLAVVQQASRSGALAPVTSAPVCEGGGAPVRASDGSYSCADGSEPECEDGMEPTLSTSGSTLICEAAPEEEEAPSSAEEYESEGTSSLVRSAS